VPVICRREFLLRVLQQAFKGLYALISRDEFALRNRNLLLQAAVLLDELALDDGELLEVALEEHHLLLLGAVVGGPEHIVVLLARLV
jgi:hypothetical protein